MINPINVQDSFVKGVNSRQTLGSQPLRPSFQGNPNFSKAAWNGNSMLPTGALGREKAVNGKLGANLNIFA